MKTLAPPPPVSPTDPPDQVVSVATLFERAAARQGSKAALIAYADGGRRPIQVGFAELAEDVERCVIGLRRGGVEPGMRTVLLVPPGRDFFALTFALFKLGAIPVFVDPGMGARNVAASLSQVRPEALVGVARAHLLRWLHPLRLGTLRATLTVSSRGLTRGWGRDLRPTHAAPIAAGAVAPLALAAILFTSGSTGPAKGVAYTHRVFDAQVRLLDRHFGYGPEDVALATFPLFALFDVALGATAVIPEMPSNRPAASDPGKLAAAIDEQHCTHLFGSPVVLGMLTAHGQALGRRFASLRRVISAGAPVRPELLGAFAKLLDTGATIHTPYGATEALPITDIAHAEILGETAGRTATGAGICVGRELPGVDLRIVPIHDGPIATLEAAGEAATGQIGEILVAGANVSTAYVGNAAATRAAKLTDGRGRVWHRMGDAGYRDEVGRVWFCGRVAHRVQTSTGVRFSVPVEEVFNRNARGVRTALIGVGRPPEETAALCVETNLRGDSPEWQRLEQELRALGGGCAITRELSRFVPIRRFPVDPRHNAKIDRHLLARFIS